MATVAPVPSSDGRGRLPGTVGALRISTSLSMDLAKIRTSRESFYSRGILSAKSPLKHLCFFALGIAVGFTLAGAAYQLVGLIGVVMSGAETLDDLHVGWFPLRALVAIQVARASGGWVYRLRSRQ